MPPGCPCGTFSNSSSLWSSQTLILFVAVGKDDSTCPPSAGKAEAGGLLQIWNWHRLHCKLQTSLSYRVRAPALHPISKVCIYIVHRVLGLLGGFVPRLWQGWRDLFTVSDTCQTSFSAAYWQPKLYNLDTGLTQLLVCSAPSSESVQAGCRVALDIIFC